MNPYMRYREPEQPSRNNSFAEILSALKLGLDAYGTYKQAEAYDRRDALTEKELAMRGEERAENTAFRKQTLEAQTQDRADTAAYRAKDLDIKQNEFNAKNPTLQPWNTSNFMGTYTKLKLSGVPVDDVPFMNDLKAMAADQTMKRGDVAQVVEMKWPEWAAQTTESLFAKASKLSDQAAKLPENDPKRQELIKQIEYTERAQKLLENIPADRAKELFFPDVVQYERNSKSALQDARLEGQQGMLDVKLKAAAENQATKQDAFLKSVDAKLDAAKEIAVGRNQNQAEIATLRARTAEEVAAARNEAQRAIQEAKGNRGPTPTEQRTTAKSIADAEAMILSNKSKEAASGQVDYFNQYAEKPYAYVWKKGSVYGGDWTKIKLPTIKGKQVTAAEVYHTATQNGITYDDVLKRIGALK